MVAQSLLRTSAILKKGEPTRINTLKTILLYGASWRPPLFVVYMLWFSRGPAALSKPHKRHSGKPDKVDLKCPRRSPKENMVAGALSLAGKVGPALDILHRPRVAWLARTQNVVRLRALGLAGVTGE
jgi:hypothetical protein